MLQSELFQFFVKHIERLIMFKYRFEDLVTDFHGVLKAREDLEATQNARARGAEFTENVQKLSFTLTSLKRIEILITFSNKKRIPNSWIWLTAGQIQARDSDWSRPRLRSCCPREKFPEHKKPLKLTFAHHKNSHSCRWGFISQLFCDSLCDDLLLWTVNSLTLWCFARVVASHESMNSWSAFLGGFGESLQLDQEQPGSKLPNMAM